MLPNTWTYLKRLFFVSLFMGFMATQLGQWVPEIWGNFWVGSWVNFVLVGVFVILLKKPFEIKRWHLAKALFTILLFMVAGFAVAYYLFDIIHVLMGEEVI